MSTELASYHVEDRKAHWQFVAEHADDRIRVPLLKLRAVWQWANEQWFGQVMTEPVILLTSPRQSRTFGDTSEAGSYGEPAEIRIRPSLLDGTHPQVQGNPLGCFRFAADVLLHESIHQYQFEVARNWEDSYHGHGPEFTGWCNKIGAALGLAGVVCRNRGGSKLPRSAQWPHCVRPPGYYLGAYDPDRDVPPPEDPPEPPETVPCPHCGGTGQVATEERRSEP